ncbi:hypothetical protein DRN86_03770, partial [Candidatus Geothermarchaeota archaeon]
GETYLIDSVDVKAALAVIKKLINLTGINVDLSEIEEVARKVGEETKRILRGLKREKKEEGRLGYIS